MHIERLHLVMVSMHILMRVILIVPVMGLIERAFRLSFVSPFVMSTCWFPFLMFSWMVLYVVASPTFALARDNLRSKLWLN